MQYQRLSPEHAETAHFDGGASSVIITITLWGARVLTVLHEDGETEADIENWPGQVYLSCLVPVEHQVRYPKEMTAKLRNSDIANIPGLGQCGVSIIFRADIFGEAMGSTQGSLPGPLPVWHIWRDSFDHFLTHYIWRVPTLPEVLSCGGSNVA